MSDVKPSATGKPTRRERALATRLRITKAAYARFCERGYAGTTMVDVAEDAGVAVQTVYFTFHTKSELLSGAYELAVLGERDPLPPPRQPWYVTAESQPELAPAVRTLVEGVGEIVRRAAPLDAVVRAAASHDPEATAIWDHHERLRIDGYRGMTEMLRSKTPLRSGLTVDRATDLLLFFLGPHAYTGLVADRGWTHETWIAWTTSALLDQLFAAAQTAGPGDVRPEEPIVRGSAGRRARARAPEPRRS